MLGKNWFQTTRSYGAYSKHLLVTTTGKGILEETKYGHRIMFYSVLCICTCTNTHTDVGRHMYTHTHKETL